MNLYDWVTQVVKFQNELSVNLDICILICRGRFAVSGTLFWRLGLVPKGAKNGNTQLLEAFRRTGSVTRTLSSKK